MAGLDRSEAQPIWLKAQFVLAIHRRLLGESGGLGGIREYSLLDSAVARPRTRFFYETPIPTIPQLAASYAIGCIQNHPFNDGNKRAGWASCRIFLELNGFSFQSPKEESYLAVFRLANQTWSERQFEEWLEQHSSLLIAH